jgi:hypothetical protein
MTARHLPALFIVWSLTAPFAAIALAAAPQVDAARPSPPTAIEQALIERACSTTSAAGALAADLHEQCLTAQLLKLRVDFGRDLGRLSASERRMLDSACSEARTTVGREAYLGCLAGQLGALHNRRSRVNRVAVAESSIPSPPVDAPADPPSSASQPPARPSRVWIGVSLLTVAVAACAILLIVRARRARRTCRVCGKYVPDSGDLCPTCRHEAAAALRRAATERADQQRAQEEEQLRLREHEAEQRQQRARQEEEARLQEQQKARQREEDARQRQAEEVHQQRGAAVVSGEAEEAFDPYAILGVAREASPDNLRAAYQEAKSKYDQDGVAHLGIDVQEHFKARAQAVDQAYQMLRAQFNIT